MGCVRKRGRSWNAQVRIAGWRSLTRTFEKKIDAERWVKETEINIKNRQHPVVDVRDISLRELLQSYSKKVSKNLKDPSVEIYRIEFFCRHPIASNKLIKLTQRHFEMLRDERLQTVSSGTVHADLMLFKRVFKVAINQWSFGLPINPVQHIVLPAPHKPRKRRLKLGEEERIVFAASQQRNSNILPIVQFAIETGMRRSEILRICWNDVSLEKGFVSLFDTKNGEDRQVPLTRHCIELLAGLPRNDIRVFPVSSTCLRLAWSRLRSKAGICDLRFHDLRHEAISRFFEMGMSVPEVALLSGHKDMRQLFRYTHLNSTKVFKKYDAFQ